MSWLATKYAWKCTNPAVKGGVRLVFLALALRVRKARITTAPTSLPQLMLLTLLSAEQVRRNLDVLCDAGEVRRLNRGKLARYGLPKMAGPLFVCDSPEESVKMTDFVYEPPKRKTGQDDRKSPNEMTGKNRAFGVVVPEVSLLSEVLSTKVRTSTTAEDEQVVEAFLDWFIEHYQRERGVLYRATNPAKAEEAAHELLRSRPIERVQAMALAMWRDTADPWLNDPKRLNDRGVCSLRHKSTYLEAIVVAAERVAPAADYIERVGYCFHTPKCTDSDVCRAKRAADKREAVG